MARSADIDRNLHDAKSYGWQAYNQPYDFSFGELDLRNVVLRGPDGVNIAIYEWVHPKRTDVPPSGAISKFFNSMQMVADIQAAKAFYIDFLGFDVIAEGDFIDPLPGPTNFGLPTNYATKIPRDYAILIAKDGDKEAGRVELMQFRGFQGRDLSRNNELYNLGISTLVFPVSDLSIIQQKIANSNIKLIRSKRSLNLPPFGDGEAVTISSPDGSLLTFFEKNE